ncbi:MAG: hypothetical protein ACJ74O_18175 [Frankiaceae bacterium]
MSFVDAAVGALTGALGGNFGPDVKPGSVAAWALTFHHDAATDLGDPILSIGSDSYDATIAATLPDDLSGGTYEVVVEGMTDEDYAKIRLATGDPLAAQLHLWWKDSPTGILGDLASFTGFTDPLGAVTPKPPDHSLVAVLRVDKLSRRAGDRRYEAVIAMRERVVARLAETRVDGRCYDGMPAAIAALEKAAHVTITTHMLDFLVPGPDDPSWASFGPGTAMDALKGGRSASAHGLLDQVRDGLKAYGPQVALIRDGALHVGIWNDTALAARTVDEDGGLLAIQRGSPKQRDAAAGERPDGAPSARDTVTVTALGRPDVKPGDTVTVTLPPEDFPATSPSSLGSALLTAAAGIVTGSFTDEPPGPPRTCLVGSVNHKLSRRAGFVTTIHAVVLASDDDTGWDKAKPASKPSPANGTRAPGSASADVAHEAARAIRDMARGASGAAANRIAQIRRHPASTQSGRTPPRHTSEAWYADVSGDGMPAAAQRVQITEKQHGEARDVPYLTPFALGNYGLVLPRYPGTRVLLASAGAGDSDLVDVGALWPRDGGPPSEAGDYWLVLPIGLVQREDIGESDGWVGDGAASHDLVDADGTRVIETKRFVVRVTDQPSDCTKRPKPGAPDGAVLIETKSGNGAAQILLKDDGSITITGTKIALDSGQGDITLTAANVKVSVTGTMDVS